MNVKKPVEFDHFEPGEAMKWVRCPKCERAVNVYGTPKHEPLTFVSATDKPEVMTHWCLVHCRCNATKVKVYGRIIKMAAYGCMAFPVSDLPPAVENPCALPEGHMGWMVCKTHGGEGEARLRIAAVEKQGEESK